MDSTVSFNLIYSKQGKKGIWINLPLQHSNLVHSAVQAGFRYHHAESDYLMLVYWIPDTPDSIPANASHRVGVGAFVVNNKREVLVVQETSGRFGGTGVWKMPTGAVNEGEDICDAVIRELKEETGVETKAHMVLVAFSSSLNSQDSCSFAGTGIQTCDGSNGGDNLSASSL
ncbi:nudix hydrolase 2 [Lathyrus oleraceus]|uniref:nudix hydrolase 2 n=1 Tax=Pisum sativum TaxID=3888 RepID=UPI0021CF6B9F|nr:nudix hydrolase 2-like [Pisum sativum]